VDLWYPVSSDGPHASDARITIVRAQSSGFGKFRHAAPVLAVEGVGGSEVGANDRMCRSVTTRFFEPDDCLIGARIVIETPNLAARLQVLSTPNTLVIGEATRRQIGGLFDLEDLGPQHLARAPQ
jgi:hypothetical protein